jgi:hypothetical protein
VENDPRINRDAQWKPGESGNPAGRPKNQIETSRYIAAKLREEETLDQLITALKLHAIKGSGTHMVEALNRVAGKVPNQIDHTNKGEPFAEASPAEMRKVAEEILDNLKFAEGRESILPEELQ